MAEATSSRNEPLRIFLWGVPRSASTVFTKFMTFVDDVSEVWFEPYVCGYSIEKGAIPPDFDQSTFDTIGAQFQGWNERKLRAFKTFNFSSTKSELERERGGSAGKYIFVKDMSWAIHGNYDMIPEKVPMRHIFLIRHPHRFLPSNYANVRKLLGRPPDAPIDTENCWLAGPKEDQMLKLWRHVKKENIDPHPLVIDSDQLLESPHRILPKLFAELGIPWKESYLEWTEKDDFLTTWIAAVEATFYGREMGSFSRAFASKNFVRVEKPIPKRDELPAELLETVDIFMPGYKEMITHALN